MRVRFADVALDPEGMELERGGHAVPVEPQVLEVLSYLVRHRDRLVPKTELLDEIWGDRFVSESALSSRIKSARQAIGDNGRDQRLIRTVHGRGFRFVGEVVADDGDRGGTDGVDGVDGLDGVAGVEAARLAQVVVDGLGRGTDLAVEVVGPSPAARERVVDDVLFAARSAGFIVGRGGGAAELRAFASVLDGLDEWLLHRPELTQAMPSGCRAELEAVLSGATPTSRQRLFLATRELVVAAGRSGGAVLAVEDVHLIDRGTLELIEYLARATRRLPVVLVVSHRQGFDLGGPFTLVDLGGPVDSPTTELPPAMRPVLARAAVIGSSFGQAELEAATGLDGDAAGRALALARSAGILEAVADAHRFVDDGLVARLVAEVPAAEQVEVHRAIAERLLRDGAPPGVVADRLEAAGDRQQAARHHLLAADAAAAVQLHGQVLERTAGVDQVQDPAVRQAMLERRADALAAVGDAEAIRRYREALRLAGPDEVPWLRTRLGRAHLLASDIEAAAEVLEGVEPTGGPHDGSIMLITGMLAYFQGDLDRAEALTEQARAMALAPGAPDHMLDVIALQGMIAHSRGEWFDRLRRELRSTADSFALTGMVFDSHLCVSQYLLYSPSGREEVIRLAGDLRARAEALGSLRAAGFAATLIGESMLLAGDLAGARAALRESVELHRGMGADTGLAHALQRLAEVELADGDRAAAERLGRQALPLARWSPLSRHLLQRVYGTLIAAAADPEQAVAVADEAMAVLDDPVSCEFCQVTVAVPAAMALAAVGRLEEARHQLAEADVCARRWDGPAWPAAVDEAAAVIARADGREGEAAELLRRAAAGFREAGQPLDAARCDEAL